MNDIVLLILLNPLYRESSVGVVLSLCRESSVGVVLSLCRESSVGVVLSLCRESSVGVVLSLCRESSVGVVLSLYRESCDRRVCIVAVVVLLIVEWVCVCCMYVSLLIRIILIILNLCSRAT